MNTISLPENQLPVVGWNLEACLSEPKETVRQGAEMAKLFRSFFVPEDHSATLIRDTGKGYAPLPWDPRNDAGFGHMEKAFGKDKICYHVNMCRDGFEGKATKFDIGMLHAMGVDISTPKGLNISQADFDRVKRQIEKLRADHGIEPAFVNFSGNSLHLIFLTQKFFYLPNISKFHYALATGKLNHIGKDLRGKEREAAQHEMRERCRSASDADKAEAKQAYTAWAAIVEPFEAKWRWLNEFFGGDNVGNIDRVLGLPGTINPKHERMVRVIEYTGALIELDAYDAMPMAERRAFNPVDGATYGSDSYSAENYINHEPFTLEEILGVRPYFRIYDEAARDNTDPSGSASAFSLVTQFLQAAVEAWLVDMDTSQGWLVDYDGVNLRKNVFHVMLDFFEKYLDAAPLAFEHLTKNPRGLNGKLSYDIDRGAEWLIEQDTLIMRPTPAKQELAVVRNESNKHADEARALVEKFIRLDAEARAENAKLSQREKNEQGIKDAPHPDSGEWLLKIAATGCRESVLLDCADRMKNEATGKPAPIVRAEVNEAMRALKIRRKEMAAALADFAWPDANRAGEPKTASIPNTIHWLKNKGFKIRFNELTRRAEVNGQVYNDDLRTILATQLHYDGMLVVDKPGSPLDSAVKKMSLDRCYHPIKDYFNSLKWDGTSRVEQFFIDYFRAKYTEVNKQIAFVWFVAAVLRVLYPGIKFDHMPLLIGPEGMGKSSGIAALVPERDWFAEGAQIGGSAKQTVEDTAGKWIIEIAEMANMPKRDIGAVKDWISRTTDTATLKYQIYGNDFPRQFVSVGNSNDNTPLTADENRRFLPLQIDKEVDVASIRRDRDQLWAEARVLAEQYVEKYGSLAVTIDRKYFGDLRELQERHRAQSPIEVRLREMLQHHRVGYVKATDVYNYLEIKNSTNGFEITHVKATMRKLNWDEGRKRLAGSHREEAAVNCFWIGDWDEAKSRHIQLSCDNFPVSSGPLMSQPPVQQPEERQNSPRSPHRRRRERGESLH